jgi:hypothetical protein
MVKVAALRQGHHQQVIAQFRSVYQNPEDALRPRSISSPIPTTLQTCGGFHLVPD